MTKSTITRERLEHYASLPSQPFVKGSGVFMYEVRQMARALLVAMESEAKEPISFDEWSRKCALQITLCYPDFREKAKYIWDSARETQHVAPALVDDVSIFEAAIEECKKRNSIDEHAWNHGILAVIAEYESCRAAMLADALQSPGSEPATVPGKWIPVSELMPEVGVKVLCFPVKDEPIHATFNGQLWLQDISWSGSDEPIDNVITASVTHWMPMPAAPREVK
ncbi:DUF551 domain-containing protein [Klebsiella pneumoniae]|nr:DUF551 domain-containing protein [Klebsiella pneumoniae]MBF8039958.1 DUF551 domain-containing protein [Klebsiella pneumoniae]MBF8096724.1 DUF551 domain-containing protein [Klebsiella pneumoniae]MBL2999317.1 DUF551 domain-containing protein [Klebsiella pneumoniae]MBV0750777.1 DUF551 domain-containing protein [Klebsiella pneumoniae]MBZ6901682.1 DUF551 domain-containing protein [Klebsiella pneumoniae]